MQSTAIVAIVLSLSALFAGSCLTLDIATPTIPPEDYTYTYREPEKCVRADGKCTYFVGIKKNANNTKYLDFYLEGKAKGWVAIGFTLTKSMFESDVLGCVRSESAVGVVDTWNVASPTRQNKLDATQNDTIKHAMCYKNGLITCNFTRKAAATDEGQDFDLLAKKYWLLYGTGLNPIKGQLPGALNYHGKNHTPTISSAKVNITGGGQAVQSHGLPMIITTSVVAITAAFVAA